MNPRNLLVVIAGLCALLVSANRATASNVLVFTFPPQPAAVHATLSPAVLVEVQDGSGNRVNTGTDIITLALNPGVPSGGSLSGTVSKTTVAGDATFSDLSVDTAASGYTLTATDTVVGTTAATSTSFYIYGPATTLTYTTSPASTEVAGAPFTVAVKAEDANANPVGGDDITITNGSGDPLAGGTATATVALTGTATFSLTESQAAAAGTSETLHAVDTLSNTKDSSPFTVDPGPVASLTFTTQPSSTETAGTSFTVVVEARDAHSNFVDGDSITITNVSGDPLAGGTAKLTTGPTGTASFTLTETKAGPSGTPEALHAADSVSNAVNSNSFTVDPGLPTSLVFTTQPSSTEKAGTSFTVAVQALDASSNPVDGDNITITNVSGDPISGGTATVTTGPTGTATFTLTETKAAASGTSETLRAADSATVQNTKDSNSFTVDPGAPTSLTFTTQPTSPQRAGTSFTVAVQALDSNSNAVDGDSITITNVSGDPITGGTATATTGPTGIASFTLTETKAAAAGTTESLLATDNATVQNTKDSNAFTVNPGPVTSLLFTTQPPNPASAGDPFGVVVVAQDFYGNPVDGDTVTITNVSGDALTGGTATTTSGASGAATFTLTEHKAATTGTTETLHAADNSSSPGPYTVNSNSFTVQPGLPTSLVFTTQPPATVTAGTASPLTQQFAVTVQALDSNSNPVDGDSVTITNQSGHTFVVNPGATATSGTNGSATFTLVEHTVNPTEKLDAVDTSLNSVLSNVFAVVHGPASNLVFSAAIVNPVKSGAVLTEVTPGPVVVDVEDADNNIVTDGPDATDDIDMALTGGTAGAVLAGTTTQTAVAGVATFPDLSVAEQGLNYQLQASDATTPPPAVANGVSTAFTVNSGSGLIIISEPPSVVDVGTTFTVVVGSYNSNGQAVQNDLVSAVASPGTAVNPVLSVLTNSQGLASFTVTAANPASGATLTFSDTISGNAPVISSLFNVSTVAKPSLTFTTEPPSSIAAGTAFPIQVTLIDQTTGKGVPGQVIGINLSGGAGKLSGPVSVTTDSNGNAKSSLSINLVGSSYLLTATYAGIPSAQVVSNPIDVVPGAVNSVVITQVNNTVTNTIANGVVTSLGTTPIVYGGTPFSISAVALDSSNNGVPNVPLTITTTPQSSLNILPSPVTTDSSGSAVLNPITINSAPFGRSAQSVAAADSVASPPVTGKAITVDVGFPAPAITQLSPSSDVVDDPLTVAGGPLAIALSGAGFTGKNLVVTFDNVKAIAAPPTATPAANPTPGFVGSLTVASDSLLSLKLWDTPGLDDQIGLAGSYPIQVSTSAFGDGGLGDKSQSAVADFIVQPVTTYPGSLEMFSSPLNYSSMDYNGLSLGSAALAGGLGLMNTNGSLNPFASGAVAVYWDPHTEDYVFPTDQSGLVAGQGYWARFSVSTALPGYSLVTRGTAPAAVDPNGSSLPPNYSGAKFVPLPLTFGWNMVGNATFAAIPLTALRFLPNGATSSLSFTDAVNAGYIVPTLYTYDATLNQYDVETVSLATFTGYWIQCYGDGTLLEPTV